MNNEDATPFDALLCAVRDISVQYEKNNDMHQVWRVCRD